VNTKSQNNRIEAFWSWFTDHESYFHRVSGATDPVFDDLLWNLQQIHTGLYFEMCSKLCPRELIFTAQGRKDLFPLVDVVVAAAPHLPGWVFIPLKPPMGFDFQTTYEGITFDPRSMWFLPLENPSNPSVFALRVGVPDYDPTNERITSNAILVIFDTSLGERSAALDIHHVDVTVLPADPESEGYIKLKDLPDYIQWWKQK